MTGKRESQNRETPGGGMGDPSLAGLHYLFEQAVEQRREAPAVRFGGEVLSYGELNRRANRCAHYLRDLGVGPDVLVGVLMERSLELVVGLLAILKAGGAYLPLAPDYPAERLEFILKDAGITLVLTHSAWARALAGLAVTTVSLDEERELFSGLPEGNPVAASGPRDLAYVIYTSGSTGLPKGCLIEHASICNRLLWMRDHYGISGADRILQKTAYTFDVSVWEFFLPLISGASLILAKPGGHKDNRYLKELIQAESITVCHFVPSMLRFFLRQEGVAQCASLRHVFASGEALSYRLMKQCLERLPARLHNLYGPTEAAVDVTYWECADRPDQKVPIGSPIARTVIRILDQDLRPVPAGESGELFIGGIGVSRGYLNRPELTRERFLKDPLASEASARLYRSGDQARLLPDGQVEYLGRLDFQVKLRGFRIELSEIEEALRGHPAVEEAAVLVREENSDDPKLVAYLVCRQQSLSVKEARDFLKRKLPEYMVPNQFVVLAALPVNGHGKLDRAALPWPLAEDPAAPLKSGAAEPAVEPPARGAVDQAARNKGGDRHAAEKVFTQLADAEIVADLRGLFQRALGAGSIPETGDLFDLGATSFTMVQAVDYIQAQYGVVVPLDVFLDSPTVQAIAAYVQRSTGQPAAGVPQGAVADGGCGALQCHEPAPLSTISLAAAGFKDEAYIQGATVRRFSGQPVPGEALGRLLTLVGCNARRSGPQYLYSSAGGLRAVQTCLFIRENGVEGMPEGYYYYHPEEHRLYALEPGPRMGVSVFAPGDREAFSKAGFVLFLIAQMDAIQSMYGNASPVLAVVEAGYMAQALMEHQVSFGLGLRPVGRMAFEAIRGGFQLEPAHQFIHCLLGGTDAGQNQESESGGAVDWAGRNAPEAGAFTQFLQAEGMGDGLPTPEQKEELHRQKLHLRRFPPGTKSIALKAWEADAGYYRLRSAKRVYRDAPVAFERFSRFMALLAADWRRGLARYLYPSVAGPHALKVFAYIKTGGVEGIPGGLYRYDGSRHQLERVAPALSTDLKSCYTPFNRKHYQSAKFCLFLVGPTASLKPLGGGDSTYYSLLESGYIGQLLLDRQAEFAMGVCPIGGMRYEKIREDFQLDPEDVFLHSFVGGEVALECPIPWDPLTIGPDAPPREGSFAAGEWPRPAAPVREAIAVVGISGRYPGAEDGPALARNLKAGRSSFKELRFDPSGTYRTGQEANGQLPALRHWGGFLEDVDCFDCGLFQITPAEARTMDPQERLLLEAAWACLENSGYTGAELNRTAGRVGVFVGAMWDDYQHFRPAGWPPVQPGEAVSAHHSSIANRVSFFFNFKGPSVAVNTSCSSALTALHFGCQSLATGECKAALVGGVNLMAHPYHQWVLTAAGLLSADEECHPFGVQANGWVAGEGVGVVLLKPLSDAVRDGDAIRGVIRGTTISHSGRTGRYGLPGAQRQAESMREALEKAGLSASDISYIEAAAPGAGMADAAEAAAIKEVFGAGGAHQSTIHVGSIKANLGHLESASAMSQLAKVLLQFQHREIFPTLQFQPVNPLVQWQDTGLKIPGAVVPWTVNEEGGPVPRRALINAFGATGSGGHLVVEEYQAPEPPDCPAETLIVLSAATQGQLAASARRLCDFLAQPDSATARMADIGYTLRVGREPMRMRLALVVHSRKELREGLEAFLAGAPAWPGVCSGEACGNPGGTILAPNVQPLEVAAKWVAGAGTLGPGKADPSQRRIPLPGYPFARERHWMGAPTAAGGGQPEAAPAALRPGIETYLKELFSQVTEIPRDRIETQARFDAYGMTSLMVRRLNGLLEQDFGKLSAALLFERQTIGDLADYFLTQHARTVKSLFPETAAPCPLPVGKPEMRRETVPAGPPALNQRERQEIAIVGVSGKYPKAANVSAFWENLRNGIDCISEIPAERWDDARLQAEAGRHSRWGGFIDGVDEFDPLFFRISPREAQEMDPQERLFLQAVWHVFEDAGYAPSALSHQTRSRMGVFVGVMYGEYQMHSGWHGKEGDGLVVSALYGSIANRVSYVLDFHGPSMAVDTLCSSSLTALHLAVQSLRAGECEAAVVGGVNVSIHPNKYLLHARLAMSSSDGRCRSFGSGGDGFVPGEGVGAILIKPLADAVRDGDQVYGVIKATVINQDGKTHGFTVPNPNAQAAMVSEAIRKAGVDPRRISYVEAHGTGTALGDPIEITGLTKAFREFTADKQFCAIGSVKSNIGHLESAAGMAGLTKILLQMRHRKLVPSLHSRDLNPEIDFKETPFFVPQSLADWEPPRVEKEGAVQSGLRLACISSFGAGGSNAHVILEEFASGDPAAEADGVGGRQLIVLSARDQDRLREVVAQLHEFIRSNPEYRLADLAATLQVGRETMEERLAFAVSSRAELAVRLQGILDGREDRSIHRGSAEQRQASLRWLMEDEDLQAAVGSWIDKGKYDQLLKAWAAGVSVDWRGLPGDRPRRRMSLPGYPFAREKYWVPQRPAGLASPSPQAFWLHPLLHRNTSDLWEQRFSSTFDGREFFLDEHRWRGERVLPAAACLELVHAAVGWAAGGQAGQIQLRNIVWAQPFVVSPPGRAIHAGLQPEGQGGLRFEIHAEGPASSRLVISQGQASFGNSGQPPELDLKGLRDRLPPADLSPAQCYEAFRAFGLEHGPAFQCLREIRRDAEVVLAKMVLPPLVAATRAAYVMHPILLDGLFQATLALGEAGLPGHAALPYALDELVCYHPCAEEMWACVRRSVPNGSKLDLDLCDGSGKVCVRIQGFSTRTCEPAPAPRAALYRPVRLEKAHAKNGSEPSWSRYFVVTCGLDAEATAGLAAGLSGTAHVVLDPGTGDCAARYEAAATQLFELTQRILAGKMAGGVLVQLLLPSGAEAVVYRGLNGLLQSAHQENPDFIGQTIELDAGQGAAEVVRIVVENRLHPEDAQIACAVGRRSVVSWERISAAEPPLRIPWKKQGVYWITGGAGGLGLLFAREIAAQTESCVLVLTGRSVLAAEKMEALRALERPGVVVQYRTADVTVATQVQALVQDIVREHGSLDGILHAAGLVRDNFILKKTAGEFGSVLAPKVRGTICLDEATREIALDFLVLFSSTGGAMGNAGQADYAAANGFLDAFAERRNTLVRAGQRQGHTLAVNWPLWQDGGMKVAAGMLKMLTAQSGMEPLESASGLRAFAEAFHSGWSQVMVLPAHREALAVPPCAPSCQGAPPPAPAARAGLDAAGPLPEKALRFFRTLLADTILCPVERIQVDESFDAYGIDSVMVMQMTNELEKSFGSLSKTLFFEHQTIRSLAGYFLEHRREALLQLFDEKPTTAVAPPAPKVPWRLGLATSLPAGMPGGQPSAPAEALDIAVIGLAGRYPQARDLEAFWENLRQGRDSITEIPPDRRDAKRFLDPIWDSPGTHFGKRGGFIDEVDAFDPLFFNIAPRDARHIDPQERLFLETAWAALEDAGYRPREAKGGPGPRLPAQVGVYAGVMYSEYQLFAHEQTLGGEPTVAGNIYASIANRVSYFLDLHGPSITIDTMCSSSLAGLHLACQDLKHKLTDMALAGGVNVTIHPNKYLLLSEGHFISGQGRCASFGAGGDGYVPGEGVGVVVLKRLAEAIRDGDRIYGVIKGTAINHGGKTHGFTVPNPDAQHAVIAGALEVAGIDASRVTYVEAHSTGTPLGDPIEIAGLARVFKASREPGARCHLGSVKSNIGHCEAAAGIAGLTKVLLQMKHSQLVPSLHSQVLNPHLNLEATPFTVNQTLRDWERRIVDGRHLPHVAGVSGFGAGGSNAHIVVEEFIESPRPGSGGAEPQAPCVIILSARNEKRLLERVGQLHRFLEGHPAPSLADLAYTLQVGRQAMEERLGFIASSIGNVSELLEKVLKGKPTAGIRRGRVLDGAVDTLRVLAEDDDLDLGAAVARWISKGKLEKVIDLWVSGMDIDWTLLYGPVRPRRISLPTYPFARDRYWLPGNGPGLAAATSGNNHGAAAEAPAPEIDEWLVVKEEWVAEPWPEPMDWPSRWRAQAGRRITLLAADDAEVKALMSAVRQGEQDAGLAVGMRLESVLLDDLDTWQLDPPPEVILLVAPVAGSPEDDQRHVAALFRLSQKLMCEAWDAPIRIFHLHETSLVRPRLRLEAVGGLVRSAMLENERHAWACISVREAADAGARHQVLVKEWLADDGAGAGALVQHQGGQRWRHRLTEVQAGSGAASIFRPRGTYVVAGGLGPIGEQLCGELARRYGARLVLLSQGGLDEQRREKCRQLEAWGASVSYYQVDIADRAALEAIWKKVKAEVGAIHGVIHLARRVEDGLLLAKSWAAFERVIRAKVDGTLNLDELSAAEPLDFFFLFSSMAAFGIRGSADYGYSAAFQNAFAGHRAQRVAAGERFGKTLACGWGSWVIDKYPSEERNARLREAGFSLITMEQAFPWIESRGWQNDPFLGLMLVHDRAGARTTLGLGGQPGPAHSVLQEVEERIQEWERRQQAGEKITTAEVGGVLRSDHVVHLSAALVDRLHAVLTSSGNGNGSHREVLVVEETETAQDMLPIIKRCLADLLDLNEVEDGKSFHEYGMNSIAGVRLAMLLEKKLKLPVLPQWLMEFPTARTLATHLAGVRQTGGEINVGGAA